MTILWGILLSLFGLVCIAVTVIGGPGTWFLLAAAVVLELAREGTFSLTTLGIALGLAVLGEIFETGASAVGASAQGGSKRGAIASIGGGIIGAILGTIFIPVPVLGTILGSALGAGLSAGLIERAWLRKSNTQSLRIGTGAAVGRLLASVLKGACCVAMWVQLTIAALA